MSAATDTDTLLHRFLAAGVVAVGIMIVVVTLAFKADVPAQPPHSRMYLNSWMYMTPVVRPLPRSNFLNSSPAYCHDTLLGEAGSGADATCSRTRLSAPRMKRNGSAATGAD
jgi:hypothetical protein